jgi:hypothetical protein
MIPEVTFDPTRACVRCRTMDGTVAVRWDAIARAMRLLCLSCETTLSNCAGW